MSNRITNIAAIVSGQDTTFSGTMRNVREELTRTANASEQIASRMRGIDVLGGIMPTFDVGAALSSSLGGVRRAYEQLQADIQSVDRRAQDAEGLGFTYNQLQALTVAATLADVPLERLSGTFARFLKSVAMAGEGSKEAQKDLARLGLTVRDFEGLSSFEAIQRVADQIAGLPTPAEKAAASMEIFGREAGLKMVEVLGQGGAALDAYMAKAVELGLTMDEQLIGKAKQAADEFDFFNMRLQARREQNNSELAGTGVGTSMQYLMNADKGLMLLFTEAAKIVDDVGKTLTIGLDQGISDMFRSIATDPVGNDNMAPSMFPNARWDTGGEDSPAIVHAENEAKKLEGIYDQIEEEQKKSAERIAAWRQQVRQQELEKEYQDVGKQIEREEKERKEAERKMADEAEKMAREVSRVRDAAARDAAQAWDSSGGGMGAAPLAVMGSAEQQLASYQASRARGNAEMRAEFIERAVEAALRKITVKTEVVQGGINAAAV